MDLNNIYPIKELSNFKLLCPQIADKSGTIKKPYYTGFGNYVPYYVEFATVWVTFIVDRLILPNKEVTKNVTIFRVKLGEEQSTIDWKLLHNGNYLTSYIDYKNNSPDDINELKIWEGVKLLYNAALR